jgi:hypothetical protein
MATILNLPAEVRDQILDFALEVDTVNICPEYPHNIEALTVAKNPNLGLILSCRQIATDVSSHQTATPYLRFCSYRCFRYHVPNHREWIRKRFRGIIMNVENNVPSIDPPGSRSAAADWYSTLLKMEVATYLKMIADVALEGMTFESKERVKMEFRITFKKWIPTYEIARTD